MINSDFFSKAKLGDNAPWLYIIGFVMVLVGYFVGQIPLVAAMYYQIDALDIGQDVVEKVMQSYNFELLGISRNVGFLLLLMMFICAMGVLYFWVQRIHKKEFKNLISPNSSIDWRRILWAFGVWFGLGLFSEVLSFGMDPVGYEFSFIGPSYFILLIICVFLLPIQTSFEELFIRGYVMQGLANLTTNKIVIIGITSAIFACLHGMNPELAEYGAGIMLFYYIIAGAFLAIITLMDGRLELALGVHAATNFYGAMITSYEGSVLQTDTLFKLDRINPYAMVVGFIIIAIIFYYFASKRYHWTSIKTLLEPIPLQLDSKAINEHLL